MSAATLVTGLVGCINDRRLPDLAACYAPGATVHPAGWPEPVDVTAWMAAFGSMLESFPDLTVRPTAVASGDGVVVLEATLVGTNSGPFHLGDVDRLILGTDADRLPPTGKIMDITGVVVLEIADGLVIRERHYWPVAETLVQLGLVAMVAAPA